MVVRLPIVSAVAPVAAAVAPGPFFLVLVCSYGVVASEANIFESVPRPPKVQVLLLPPLMELKLLLGL